MQDEGEAKPERGQPRQRRRRSGSRSTFRRVRRLLLPRSTGARLKLTLICLVVASFVYLLRNAPPSPALGPAKPERASGEREGTSAALPSFDGDVVVRRLDAPSTARAIDRPAVDAAARPVPLEALRERMLAFERPVVHELGEGDSLWRLLRRVVVDDAVLLDRLLDQLAASGMRVDAVRAGREVVVDAGVPDGHRLRVDDGDAVYVSGVADERVTTAAHRIVTVPLGATPRQDIATSALPDGVIDILLAPDGPWRAAFDAPSPGERLDLLLVTTRASDTDRATTRIAALSTPERTIDATGKTTAREPRDP